MSLDHVLAKELRDGGFRRNHDPKGTNSIKNIMDASLEELIEACGKGLNCLEQGEDEEATAHWQAQNFDRMHKIGTIEVGATPTDAVARLWLALNKKV